MSGFITKADGEREPFDPSKLLDSLARAGATPLVREQVLRRIERELVDGMTTWDIYRHAFEYLKEVEDKPVAARYSIKRAVFDLGPSGFPFEQFVAELLKAEGWHTRTGVALTGRCAPHEVDVFARRGMVVAGIEVKFHNEPGTKTDLKDALYVHARFEDLKQAPDEHSRVTEGWLVTNTRFTRNALRYGRCSGLTMVGWDYPRHHSILAMVERSGIHPLTTLTTLTDREKHALLDDKIVLCTSLRDGGHLLREHGVNPAKIPAVLSEVHGLCAPSHRTALSPVNSTHYTQGGARSTQGTLQ